MSRVDYCNAVFAGSPRYVTDKLQCVLNAAACLVTGTHKFDHSLSHLLHEELHWLDVLQCIHYKLGVAMQYKAPEYLVNCCIPVSDIPSRCHLRSTTRHHLTITRYRLSTFSRRAFSVAGPTVWNLQTFPDIPGQSLWPGAQQQQLQTIAENEPISSLPLSAHSAVEMLHNSVQYKSIIHIDIDNNNSNNNQIQSHATAVTYSNAREVRQRPHLDRAISWCRSKALVDWRKLDTPDAAGVTRAHTDERQISCVPHLHHRHLTVSIVTHFTQFYFCPRHNFWSHPFASKHARKRLTL